MGGNQILEHVRSLYVYDECMRYGNELADRLARVISGSRVDAVMFSGGIDTSYLSYTTLRLVKKNVPLVNILYSKREVPQALKGVADTLGAELLVVRYDVDEFLPAVREMVGIMRSYHPVEVVETAVIYLGYRKLSREYGVKYLVSGDGSDEIFYGYPYLWGLDPEAAKNHSVKIIAKNVYPSKIINRIVGEDVVLTPYLDGGVINFGLSLPHRVKINTFREGIFGKFFMRVWLSEALPEHAERFWTPKQPIRAETGIPMDAIESLVPPSEVNSLMKENNVILRSSIHAYLFKAFREAGLTVPGRTGKEGTCPHCGSPIDRDLLRCDTCGWWANIHGY